MSWAAAGGSAKLRAALRQRGHEHGSGRDQRRALSAGLHLPLRALRFKAGPTDALHLVLHCMRQALCSPVKDEVNTSPLGSSCALFAPSCCNHKCTCAITGIASPAACHSCRPSRSSASACCGLSSLQVFARCALCVRYVIAHIARSNLISAIASINEQRGVQRIQTTRQQKSRHSMQYYKCASHVIADPQAWRQREAADARAVQRSELHARGRDQDAHLGAAGGVCADGLWSLAWWCCGHLAAPMQALN